MTPPDAPFDAAASARRTLTTGQRGIEALLSAFAGPLGAAFAEAVARITAARGRLVVTGMGKSGHVARKITATLASTGTPALFVHPAEAGHGDLGMITSDDLVLALSAGGESTELAAIIAYTRRFTVPLIAMTAAPASTLARAADLVLLLPRAPEACPHGLAPTTSTLLQLATGDALAVALLEARGFSAEDFHIFHPGGKLGAGLKKVREIMHSGGELPLVAEGADMRAAVAAMTSGRLGCVGVTDRAGRLTGIITDGDLRRHLTPDLLGRLVETVMTRHPKAVAPETLLAKAMEIVHGAGITTLFVVEGERPVGIIHMHDLLRAGVA